MDEALVQPSLQRTDVDFPARKQNTSTAIISNHPVHSETLAWTQDAYDGNSSIHGRSNFLQRCEVIYILVRISKYDVSVLSMVRSS